MNAKNFVVSARILLWAVIIVFSCSAQRFVVVVLLWGRAKGHLGGKRPSNDVKNVTLWGMDPLGMNIV